ncbi:hypothetical protein [Williamsia sterculiae]|uniref:Uncharacterized protein n=1 Tax=Williamsia sterculiae TaxID=1344003 RepID=A0A1N7HAQ7_9NOCA|nr:hypothetical protein [Williamsia sterculiae]SIS21965.1 hypothetical protein SAMN05445060_3842 [Williamsia sterculiae]
MARETDSASTHDWPGMTDWIVESLSDQPTGFVFELGPRDYGPAEDDEGIEAINAQVQVLRDGVLLLRRSRTVLYRLFLGDYRVADLPLNRWLDGEHFDDCTDGYIFSRDVNLIAEAMTAWFRHCGLVESPQLIGCDYEFPDVLLPEG